METCLLHRRLHLSYRGLVCALGLLVLTHRLLLHHRIQGRITATTASQEQLRATLDALPDIMFRVDREGRIFEYHTSATDQLFAAPDFFLGKKFSEVLPDEAAHIIQKALDEAAVHGRHRGAIYSLPMPQRRSWYELSIAAMETKPVGTEFIVLARDVTERRKAEEELRAREERHRLIANIAVDNIWTMSPDGKLTSAAPSIEKLTGYTPAEFVQLSLEQIIAPGSIATATAYLGSLSARIQAGLPLEDFHGELELRCKDGSSVLTEVIASPHRDAKGNVVELVGVTRDITARKQAEEALRKSEWKYRIVGDNTYDWEFWTDPQGRFIYCSHSCQQITGYTAEEFMTNASLLGEIIHPEDRIRYLEHARYFSSLSHPGEISFRVIRPDGTERWIGQVSQPVRDAVGVSMGRRGSNRDITQQKQTEAAIRELNNNLERKVEVRTAEVSAARFLAEQAMAQVAKSEAKFRAMFEEAPLGVSLMDSLNGQFHEVNQRFVEIVGWTREELAARDWTSISHPSDVQTDLDNVSRLNAGDIFRFQMKKRFIRPDGSIVWTSMTVAPATVEAGQTPRRLCMVEDITDRERAQEEWRRLNRALVARSEFGQSLALATREDELLTQMCHILVEKGGYRLAWVGYVEPDELKSVRPVAQAGSDAGYVHAAKIACMDTDRGRGPTGTCIRSAHAVAARHIATDPAMAPWREAAIQNGYASLAAFPLLHDGQVLGALNVYAAEPDSFDHGEASLLTDLAADLAHGIATLRIQAAHAQAEAALRESERRFRELFAYLPLAYQSLDADGRYIDANQGLADLLGFDKPEELLGRSFGDFWYESACWDFEHCFAEFKAKQTTSNELNLRHKDGRPVTVFLSGRVQRDEAGNFLRTHCILLDITERRAMEEQIRQLNSSLEQAVATRTAELRTITDAAHDAIVMMNPDGAISYWNPAAERIFGYDWKEAIGKNMHDLLAPERYHSGYRAGFPEFAQSGRGNAIGKTQELFARRRDGQEIPVSLSLSAVRLHDGWHAVGILADITKRKQTEIDLRAAKQTAEAASRAKGEFLANMSHEIRTPMNGVIGMTGLLLDTALSTNQRRYAETIRSSGENLLALINDILDFSKIESGKLELEAMDFDLRVLLDDFAAPLGARAQSKGLEFICAASPEVPSQVCGAPDRLCQILNNLAGNALKFTEQGEISVLVKLVRESEFDVVLRFVIRDTGIGIGPDTKAKLFQKFTQADASTTRRYGGTGLGLAIAKELVLLMGGEIGVTSEAGAGSEFWFTLPFGKPGRPTGAAPLPPDLGKKRILVVDDNATNREVLLNQLSSLGVFAEAAPDGPSALMALKRASDRGEPFHAAILDMQMPGMDGAELARAIQADAMISGTCLVLLTSLGHGNRATDSKALGFSGCLTKPVRQSELLESLAAVFADVSKPQAGGGILSVPPTTDLYRQGARILVAEDNPVNQEVALGILTKFGLRADAVSDGVEAINALTTLPYDLVFMDVQMPRMDGLEATRIIRNRSSTVRNHAIPVIAMTAGAMASDRDRCLEAGMNGFISKPVSSRALKESLNAWIPQYARSVEPPFETTKEKEMVSGEEPETPIFDLAGLSERMMNDSVLISIILNRSLGSLPALFHNLRDSLGTEDTDEVQNAAHILKGVAGNIGGERVRRLASLIEEAAESGDLAPACEKLTILETELDRLRDAIRAHGEPGG